MKSNGSKSFISVANSSIQSSFQFREPRQNFSSYLPLFRYVFRHRIAICPKSFTNFQNLCSCLFS
uniref:V-type proton ATPase subunit a n=1 Tax=Rhizophora mucronata TaxID=61149 RepID=A0A2P2LRW9_RHIMU